MLSRSSDPHQKSLKIKQDDKFYTKLLSKESSAAHPSFRVYYGVASGAVPFVWESRPGTPKNSIPSATLPPLTPPPSYHVSTRNKKKSSPRSTIIHSILPLLSLKKAHAPPSPPSSASLSSSSTSSWPSSYSPTGSSGSHRRTRFSSSRSSFSSLGEDDDSDCGPRGSIMCFGVRHRAGGGGLRGCNSAVIVKKALLSVVGNGSGQGTAA